MTLSDSFPTEDSGGLSITDWRLIMSGLIARDGSGAPRLGVFPTHTTAIVTGTSGMSYSVGSFIAATSRNGAGIELVANDGATAVATTAAPGSNSRIDVIWVRCRFPSYTDSGQTTPTFGVTQGTAAGSPTKPAIPAGALELATATVPSSATATNSGVVITQTFRYTATAGGIVLVRNAVERAAWAPADGAICHQLDSDVMYARIDGAWQQIAAKNRLTDQATNNFVSNASPIIYTGIAQGTTTPGGVLIHSFPTPFPTHCFGVFLAPDTLSNFDNGAPPVLVSGQVSRTGFQSFWGGRGSAAVGVAYMALGI